MRLRGWLFREGAKWSLPLLGRLLPISDGALIAAPPLAGASHRLEEATVA